MAVILNFGSRTTSGNVRGDTLKSGMVDNVGIAVGIAAPQHAVQKLFSLQVFAGRHLEFWWYVIVYQRRSTSGSVNSVKPKSGMVENVGVVVGIVSVCCWKLKLHWPSGNLRFFHLGCPWFSKSLQVRKRATFTRKTQKHQKFDPLGIGFDRSIKYSNKHRGRCKFVHPRGSRVNANSQILISVV